MNDGLLIDGKARARLEPQRAVRQGLDGGPLALGHELVDGDRELVELSLGGLDDGLRLGIDEDALAGPRRGGLEGARRELLAGAGDRGADADDVLVAGAGRGVARRRSEREQERQDERIHADSFETCRWSKDPEDPDGRAVLRMWKGYHEPAPSRRSPPAWGVRSAPGRAGGPGPGR